MQEQFKSILKRIFLFFQNTEKKKLILLAAIAAGVIVVGIVGAVLLNRVTYAALYSGLSEEEAGSIMTLLKEKGVTAKAKGTDTILVPEDEADELRIELASQGYPNTGLNYDIFSNSSDIGSTDLERQTYLQYQLQENMRTTISRMSKVEDCIIIVNLATSSSFVVSKNITEASVAILLSLKAGEELTSAEAKAIGEFVVRCVPKLEKKNISIVDSDMNYYDIISEDGTASTLEYSQTQQQLTEQMKKILTEQALHVLEPAIGDNNVAVSVNLNLDFDKETVNTVEFSPPVEGESQGMLISSEELSDTAAFGASGAPGTDSNGVSASQYVSKDAGDSTSESYTKTYNYELNKIQKQIEKAQGTVQDLSVAVLINSSVDGIDEHLGTVKSLVAKAIGVDSEYVSVEVMPFVKSAGELEFGDYFAQNQETMKRLSQINLIKTLIIAVALIIAVFMVMRMLLSDKDSAGLAMGMAVAGGATDLTILETMDGDAEKAKRERLLEGLALKKSDEAEKVETLMELYPEAVVQIIRYWLVEDR